jgi:nucleotidyltransferase/DNA polymerase involved in DNA repair
MLPTRSSRVKASARIACFFAPDHSPEITEQLWEALGTHSPSVELEESSSLLYLDAKGISPRYGNETGWCRAVLSEAQTLRIVSPHLGLAGSKFAAWVAAQSASDAAAFQIVSESDARFLAPLPLDWLPLSDEIRRRLRLLGLPTLGRFAALPSPSVAEQFGPESLAAWRWARGQDERPVLGRRCQTVSATHLFEVFETRVEALVEASAYLAERALRDLPVDRQVWAIRRVNLEACTTSGETLSHSAWLGEAPGPETLRALLLRMVPHLHGKGKGIVELKVSLWGLEPAPARQLTLLEAQDTDRQWRQVVRTIQRRSPEGLLRPVLISPEAPILTERYTLQRWSL